VWPAGGKKPYPSELMYPSVRASESFTEFHSVAVSFAQFHFLFFDWPTGPSRWIKPNQGPTHFRAGPASPECYGLLAAPKRHRDGGLRLCYGLCYALNHQNPPVLPSLLRLLRLLRLKTAPARGKKIQAAPSSLHLIPLSALSGSVPASFGNFTFRTFRTHKTLCEPIRTYPNHDFFNSRQLPIAPDNCEPLSR
jgi:hypothetical protein